jgi:hypothetical protein
MSRTKIIFVALGILILVGMALTVYRLNEQGAHEVVNTYRTAQYALTYPLDVELEEASPESYMFGKTASGGFDAAVAVLLIPPAPAGTGSSLDAYILTYLKPLCIADVASDERIVCEGIERSSEHKTTSGENVTEYYLTLAHTKGSATEKLSFGPFYVFLLSPTEDRLGISPLVLYTPVIDLLTETQDTALLTRIVEGLTLGGTRK